MNRLRADPTRTTLIRRRFIAEMNRRFKKLRAAVREFLVELDALGLKEKKLGFSILAQPREFEFRTDPEKLKAFNEWLRQQIEKDIFSVPRGTPVDEPWMAKYIESAFKRGHLNAFLSTKEAQLLEEEGIGQQSLDSFLRTSFNKPETTSKARLLATRAFEDLKGITSTVSSQLSQILAQGIIDGTGVEQIVREMTNKIDSLTSSRALTIARTEIISAHSEGQLDAFERLNVDELGVKAEWSTAGDDRVCPECSDMEGKTFTVDEARGLIPLHPNCRCAWIPALDQEKERTPAAPSTSGFQARHDPENLEKSQDNFESFGKEFKAVFSESETDALQRYAGSASTKINDGLRKGNLAFPDLVSHLDSAMEKSTLPGDTLLFRGISKSVEVVPGTVFEDAAFLSTSIDPRVPSSFGSQLIMIRAPEGAHAIHMGDFSTISFEQEILLDRGSRLLVSEDTVTLKVDGKDVTFIVADLIK